IGARKLAKDSVCPLPFFFAAVFVMDVQRSPMIELNFKILVRVQLCEELTSKFQIMGSYEDFCCTLCDAKGLGVCPFQSNTPAENLLQSDSGIRHCKPTYGSHCSLTSFQYSIPVIHNKPCELVHISIGGHEKSIIRAKH